jgi:hypothetical protein
MNKAMPAFACVLAGFFVAGYDANAQIIHPVEKKTLTASSSTLTDVPTFSSFGPARCDSKGNLYFQVGEDSATYRAGVVMRLSKSSRMPTLFKAPTSASENLSFMEFTVTPSGQTWILEQTDKGSYEVFGFGSEDTTPTDIHLGIPEHLDITDFIVSELGPIFIGGFYHEQSPKTLRGQSFSALVDRAGKIIRDFGSEGQESIQLSEVRKKLHDGAGSTGPDGDFYFLQGSEIRVLSATGDLVRTIPVQKPEPELAAHYMTVTGSLISIQFVKADKDGMILSQYLVLDAGTGEPYALYTPSEELGNTAVCFSPNGYTFLRVENGHIKFLSAPLS